MSNEYKEWLRDLRNAPKGSKDYNRWLTLEYPFLIPRHWDTNEVIEDYDYSYTLLDDMPDGWRDAFGEQMCAEIKQALIEADCLDKYGILQIKEKFGELRWYDSSAPKSVNDIVTMYELISAKTCIKCGKPATQISTGWICPWCDDCAKSIYDKKIPIDEYYK